MSNRESALERMRRELGEANPARLARQTAVSLSTVATQGGAATAALEPSARRNLYILSGIGVVTTVLNPLAVGWLASGQDWLFTTSVAVLTFPFYWLQPSFAAIGAAGILLTAIWTSGYSRITRSWVRVAQTAAIVAAVASVGLILVGIAFLVAAVLLALIGVGIVFLLFALLVGS